jgi:hypothetical protein
MEKARMHRLTAAAALLLVALPLAAQAQESQPVASEGRGKVRAACQADIQKFCANIERAKGAMRACLDANQNDLSAGCNAARAERAAARAKEKS